MSPERDLPFGGPANGSSSLKRCLATARDVAPGRERPMSGYHSVQPVMPCPEVGMIYGYDII